MLGMDFINKLRKQAKERRILKHLTDHRAKKIDDATLLVLLYEENIEPGELRKLKQKVNNSDDKKMDS